jgi:hypothetical protein
MPENAGHDIRTFINEKSPVQPEYFLGNAVLGNQNDGDLTETINNALSGQASTPDTSHCWTSDAYLGGLSTRNCADINNPMLPPTNKNATDLEAEKKALEVLRVPRDFGYTARTPGRASSSTRGELQRFTRQYPQLTNTSTVWSIED